MRHLQARRRSMCCRSLDRSRTVRRSFSEKWPVVHQAAHHPAFALASASDYTGPLYALQRSTDNATLRIGLKGDTGFADSGAQTMFCTKPSVSICTVTTIFDQTGRGNHLERVIVSPNNSHGWPTRGINAMRDYLSVGGHGVFSAYFEGGQDNIPGTDSGTMGFRSNRINGNASGVAVGEEPESIYMVTSGTHYNHGQVPVSFDFNRIRFHHPSVFRYARWALTVLTQSWSAGS